jgi:hypothetical protein
VSKIERPVEGAAGITSETAAPGQGGLL